MTDNQDIAVTVGKNYPWAYDKVHAADPATESTGHVHKHYVTRCGRKFGVTIGKAFAETQPGERCVICDKRHR